MPLRHVLLAFAVAVFWGLNFVVIDVGLDSFPPLLFAALRFTFVAFPAVLFVRRPPIGWRWIVAVGATLCGGQFALLFVAMDQGMPAGLASVVIQLQAVFTVALAVGFLGERLGAVQLAGAAVALVGIAIIAAGRADGVTLVGVALTVAAAATWGVGNVCTRRAQAPDAIALLVWASLVAPLPLLALSLVLEGPGRVGDALAGVDAGGAAALLYVVVVSTAFGFGAWSWLLKRHAASRVAPFALLVPPVGIVSAWLLVGERPNAAELAGAVVVLVGLTLTTRAVRRSAPAAATANAPALSRA